MKMRDQIELLEMRVTALERMAAAVTPIGAASDADIEKIAALLSRDVRGGGKESGDKL